MKLAENTVHSHGKIIGFGVCPKCKVINKIRAGEETAENKGRCRFCGEEIAVKKIGPAY